MSEQLNEEEWEHEIGQLFGDLPMVEPPEGFLAKALDRPPMYAGRTTALSIVASVVAVVLISSTGLLREETFVPDLNALVSRHSATEAGLFGGVLSTGGLDTSDSVFVLVEQDVSDAAESVELPPEFEWEANFGADGVSQGVYIAGDKAVSVFTEPGRVDPELMPAEDHLSVGEFMVWADSGRNLVTVQTADSVVTVVGLDVADLTAATLVEITASLEAEGDRSFWQLAGQELNMVTRQLGFPDLD